MARLTSILLLLLGVSFVLAPLSTLHAHLGGAHNHHGHVAVHGGHVHEVADDTGQIFDVNFAMADRGSSGFNWTNWLPLVSGLAFVWLIVRYPTLIVRASYNYFPSRLQLSYWRPPLRGPPGHSI